MRLVLVTGVSGSGKSSVVRQLRVRGHRAVSLDSHPGLCAWTDAAGGVVPRPDQPSAEWLSSHNWIWRDDVFDDLVAELRGTGTDTAFLAGISASTEPMADRFDLRILLRIDPATMLARLDNETRGNDFGRIGATRQLLIDCFADVQGMLERLCDAHVDATVPLAEVTTRVEHLGRNPTHLVG